MQKVKLPKQLDPFKSAVKRASYEGVMMATDMQRLAELVTASQDTVDIELSFDIDSQKLAYFQGQLSLSVSLVCQRCNSPFSHPVSVTFRFCPIRPGQDVDEIPDAYDPVEVNDHGEIDLLQLFEDELMLALPIVPMHVDDDCTVGEDDMSFGAIEPADEQPNPFAVLKQLKRNQE